MLKQYFAGKIADIGKMVQSLRQTASDLGLPFGEVTHIYNTRLAQEMGCWAEAENKGPAFHHAVFVAYFVEGKNLSDPQVLEHISISIGLDGEAARRVITHRLFKDRVDADWNSAIANAVTAVPTLMLNQDRMVGAQSYEKLKNLMRHHNVRRKE